MKYVANIPFQDDMGSIAPIIASSSPSETARQNALWQLNSMREHDNLPPLNRLPEGTTLLAC